MIKHNVLHKAPHITKSNMKLHKGRNKNLQMKNKNAQKKKFYFTTEISNLPQELLKDMVKYPIICPEIAKI